MLLKLIWWTHSPDESTHCSWEKWDLLVRTLQRCIQDPAVAGCGQLLNKPPLCSFAFQPYIHPYALSRTILAGHPPHCANYVLPISFFWPGQVVPGVFYQLPPLVPFMTWYYYSTHVSERFGLQLTSLEQRLCLVGMFTFSQWLSQSKQYRYTEQMNTLRGNEYGGMDLA